jgi:hypothetical protein
VPKSGWHRSPQGQAAVAAGVAAAVVAVVVTLALTGNWLPAQEGDPHSASNASAQPTALATAAPAAAPAAAAQRTPAPRTSASTKAAKEPVLVATHPAVQLTAKHPATTSPSATPPVGHPTTPAPPSPTGTPAPSPPLPSATPTPTPGTLAVSTDTLDLTPFQPSGTITLTAENGPVTWSISQTDGPAGALVISPAEGLLAAGQSVQVAVAVESAMPRFSADLMVNPGGQTVMVVYHVGHGSY